jgi:D-alanyl-D-alanine carboxypeptidase/D-alanyl-D-alanine-endopeptidase (penicillin-binding protein 4)
MRNALLIVSTYLSAVVFTSCSVQKRIHKSAKADVLNVPALATAHVGISIYDAEGKRFLYNYQGDKYFVPASNTKIPTCYAAMKYLGDSLVSARYIQSDSSVTIYPAGDPTVLHSAFTYQPLLKELQQQKKILIDLTAWQDEALGSGWSWNDYDQSYMTERSALPLYGNLVRFIAAEGKVSTMPHSIPLAPSESIGSALKFDPVTRSVSANRFGITRGVGDNVFTVQEAESPFTARSVPFRTTTPFLQQLLQDTLKGLSVLVDTNAAGSKPESGQIIHSQPTDSLLKPMMHRSDNFFAEQALLMVSNEVLGVMNDAKIIDTLLKTDFKDLPQKPRWVDGSGLSRYNLFTPQDFVAILNKMKDKFGMERLKEIFATGGEGTLSDYYRRDSSFLFAKTGTLSGVVAISGFLYTSRNRLLLFSVLVNNHQASGTEVRRAVERFIQCIRRRY